MRSYAVAALEDVSLWHERDISHSSVERVICPDATILLDFMLDRFTRLMENLMVYPDRMLENLNMTRGLIYSQMVLLKLIDKGESRERAYAMVQRNAMRSWENGLEFRELLMSDQEIMSRLNNEDLESIFSTGNFLKQVDFIFNRVFKTEN
jgi:adenylosuccinate lyase